jgi:hypothetical protein
VALSALDDQLHTKGALVTFALINPAEGHAPTRRWKVTPPDQSPKLGDAVPCSTQVRVVQTMQRSARCGFPEFLQAPGLMSIAAVRRVETADDGMELF